MTDTLLQNQTDLPWTREALDARRQAIAMKHGSGATGTEVVTALTELADEILLALYAKASEGASEVPGVALVALGGYGRRELAPYSDIALMFLYAAEHESRAQALSTSILHTLWDLGFEVGHYLRQIADRRTLGRTDLTIRTSLMEARWLAGDRRLYEEFVRVYREQVSCKGV